MITKLLKIKY